MVVGAVTKKNSNNSGREDIPPWNCRELAAAWEEAIQKEVAAGRGRCKAAATAGIEEGQLRNNSWVEGQYGKLEAAEVAFP